MCFLLHSQYENQDRMMNAWNAEVVERSSLLIMVFITCNLLLFLLDSPRICETLEGNKDRSG